MAVNYSDNLGEIHYMVPGRTQGWPRGGVVNWLGGGGVTRATQCRPRRVWGHAPPEFVLINLIEYGVSFCILKYKSLSLYLWKWCAGGTRYMGGGRGGMWFVISVNATWTIFSINLLNIASLHCVCVWHFCVPFVHFTMRVYPRMLMNRGGGGAVKGEMNWKFPEQVPRCLRTRSNQTSGWNVLAYWNVKMSKLVNCKCLEEYQLENWHLVQQGIFT